MADGQKMMSNKWMDSCAQNGMNAGANQQASTAHCECTAKKIEKKYASYQRSK